MTFKRILSVLLALALLMGVLQVSVFASVDDVSTTGLDLSEGLPTVDTTWKAGGGTIVYTASTKTLTLNNAEISVVNGFVAVGESPTHGISLPSTAVEIILVGKNSISAVDGRGIFSGGDLTVSGNGSLNITVKAVEKNIHAIYASDTLTITATGNISVIGYYENNSLYSASGFSADSGINISNANIFMNTYGSCMSTAGNFDFTNTVFELTVANLGMEVFYVYYGNGSVTVTDMTVTKGGTVDGNGILTIPERTMTIQATRGGDTPPEYAININASHGIAHPSTASAGAIVRLDVNSADNRPFKDWTLTGVTVDDYTQTPLFFIMPENDVTAVANFEDILVDAVKISPTSVTLAREGTQKFTATVEGTPTPSQGVTWSVVGNASSTISTDGILTIADDETAASFKVRATSKVDANKYAEATVTVSNPVPVYYTVTFDLNGGSGETPTQVPLESGKTFQLPTYNGTKEGYIFTGWSDGTNFYDNGTNYVMGNSDVTLSAQWVEGEMTHRIDTAAELIAFATEVNSGVNTYSGRTVLLDANITLTEEWTPIGGVDSYGKFEGRFEGRGNTISNVKISSTSSTSAQGFFGFLPAGATVENLNLANVSINVTGEFDSNDNRYDSGSHAVGGVVAVNHGTINSVNVSGTVNGVVAVGGIVGYNTGTVQNCKNSADVTGSLYSVGGIAGFNKNTINDSSNSGDVTGNQSLQAYSPLFGAESTGGAVGRNLGGLVVNVFITGDVTQEGDGTKNVGGVIGYNEWSGFAFDTVNVYNQGVVSGDLNVGGIIGLNQGTLNVAYNSGTVTASGGVGESGGLVGEQTAHGEVTIAYYATDVASNGVGTGETGESVGAFKRADGLLTDLSHVVNGKEVITLVEALGLGAGVYNSSPDKGILAKGWGEPQGSILPSFSNRSASEEEPAPTYNVTFIENGGKDVGSMETLTTGKLPYLPTTTREHFTFVRWEFKDGTPVTADTVYNARTTLYAIWKSNADIDGVDGVGVGDLQMIAQDGTYNTADTTGGNSADVNNDGKINFADLAIARNSQHFGS